jgi:tRNA-specific 2-thiouridylase
VDETGSVVGGHDGANAFTVGQRRGLKLGRPAADGKPRFVLEIRPKENKVVVGPEALLAVDQLRGIKVSWAGLPVDEVAALLRAGAEQAPARSAAFDCMVQVRAHGDPVAARAWVELAGGRQQLVVTLVEPMRGVAPGQTMVLYQGTRVLGQATIDSARSLSWDPAAVPAGA